MKSCNIALRSLPLVLAVLLPVQEPDQVSQYCIVAGSVHIYQTAYEP